MESVEVTVRRIQPQPLATVSAGVFDAWSQAVLEHIAELDATRSANHPIGPRLRSMASFFTKEMKQMSRREGSKVLLNAGEFHWFLCKFLQRQERVKALLSSADPFVEAIDPALRRLIKQGWDVPKWPPGYWKMVDQLRFKMEAGRAERRSGRLGLSPSGD
jgi:hypothetical protein